MKQLIIDLGGENDPAIEEQVVRYLSTQGIRFHTMERQTIEEYNAEIEEGNAQIERGEFTTAEDLKKEVRKW